MFDTTLTDPYEAALSASTLVSMIPTHTHVQSVYTGAPSSSSGTSSSVSPDSTVLAALKGGKLGKNEVENTLCIEQSTIRMDVSQQVGKEIEGAGGMWVDAPVSGGESSRCPRHRRHYYINLISSASDTI
jgi:3-hydroxyisobutyrate dehydrogenase-like beta-hydroxyacid dehydrogenase